MRWIRVDVGLYRNGKLYDLPEKHPRALIAYIGGLLLAGELETDGFIRTEQLRETRGRRAEAAILEARGLWIPVEGGWQIHGWDERQPSTKSLEAQRESARAAGRKRWGRDDPTP